jgi:RNA-binding protein
MLAKNVPSRSDGEDLRKLGKVLHVSKSHALIVKLDSPRFVKAGTKSCDSKLKSVGVVTDILGPVTAPYLSVKPTVAKPESVVGRTLYAIED